MSADTDGTIVGRLYASYSIMNEIMDRAGGFATSGAVRGGGRPGTDSGSRSPSERPTGGVEREPSAVVLERRGDHVVAVPKQSRTALKAAAVEDVTTALRNLGTIRELSSDHQRLEARSVALHSAVVRKIARDPDLLRIPKRNLERWQARSLGPTPICFHEWSRILRKPWAEIAEFIVSGSEDAIRLRQSSPFAGVLTAAERKRIYDAFRP